MLQNSPGLFPSTSGKVVLPGSGPSALHSHRWSMYLNTVKERRQLREAEKDKERIAKDLADFKGLSNHLTVGFWGYLAVKLILYSKFCCVRV